MEPQTAFALHQVLDVDQKLIFGLFHVLRAVQQLANFGQRQHAHHQGIVPQLLMVFLRQRDMLHTSALGAWHFMHQPFRPPFQIR
ncbi:hypothetical protein D3C75_941740 [compost metagenome]